MRAAAVKVQYFNAKLNSTSETFPLSHTANLRDPKILYGQKSSVVANYIRPVVLAGSSLFFSVGTTTFLALSDDVCASV